MTKKMRACSWTLFCLVSVCVSASALMASLLSSSLRWQHSTPLPEARAGYAAGVLHGKLVIAGGTYWEGEKGNWTQKIFSARTHIFDPIGQSWKRLPDAPSPFGYAASTVVDNKLYVLGGYTGKDVNRKVFTLERKGTRYAWNVYGDMPEPRLFAWAVSVGSSIYLLGGTIRFEPYDAAGTCCTSQSATNSFMVLNTTRPAEGWRRLSPFPGAKRWGFSSETDGSFIWMFGGIYQAKPKDPVTKFDEVLRYNIVDGTWESMPPLPEATRDATPLTPVFTQDRIILVSFAKKVWQLNLKTLEYSQLAPLPEEAFVDKFVWINYQIIGAGGENRIEAPRRRSEWTFIGRFTAE